MTKKVRIENADGGHDVELLVELVELNPETKEERVISKTILSNPADLAEIMIWDKRYIRITEA
jgi:hypothetical protein